MERVPASRDQMRITVETVKAARDEIAARKQELEATRAEPRAAHWPSSPRRARPSARRWAPCASRRRSSRATSPTSRADRGAARNDRRLQPPPRGRSAADRPGSSGPSTARSPGVRAPQRRMHEGQTSACPGDLIRAAKSGETCSPPPTKGHGQGEHPHQPRRRALHLLRAPVELARTSGFDQPGLDPGLWAAPATASATTCTEVRINGEAVDPLGYL